MGSPGHAASVRLRHAVLAGILAAVAAPLHGAVLHVAPGDSIQTALDRAATGDQVVVVAGTFLGDPTFVARPCTCAAPGRRR